MFVSDWMTTKLFTLTTDDSLADAIALLKERGVKHLPVLEEEILKGILTDRDVSYYILTHHAHLDSHELKDLLSKTRTREVMKTNIVTTRPNASIEEAAKVMYELKVGCLPVIVDNRLIGIISRRDIQRAIIEITGVIHGGHRIYLTVSDKPGSIKDVSDRVRKYGFRLQSILTSYEGVAEGYRKIVIRTKGAGDLDGLRKELGHLHGDVMMEER